ncbi:hypothetical protein B5X24_HaOG211856 [Helicoverpa armigera]|nr:hypothetical protein B5X24_HaOG211856 [Helicoverpa armigera]
MAENKDETAAGLMNYFPNEILESIFVYLSSQDLVRCRTVCSRWRGVVDHLCTVSTNQHIWHKCCKDKFPNVYTIARKKSKRGLHWYNLYRSLMLWKQLQYASEERDEFATATFSAQEIRNFELLGDGILGVLKRGSIVYYDIETLALSRHKPIIGDYCKYTENENVVVILSYDLQLFIIRKRNTFKHFPEEVHTTFESVKLFVLVAHELFFVNVNDEIFRCDLRCIELTADFLVQTDKAYDGILSIGYSHGNLNILTFQRNIYVVLREDLLLQCTLDTTSNLLHELHYYNFLEHLDWRIYFQWMYTMNHVVPDGPLRDIVFIRSYGDVYFVGCNWGILRIYYAPYNKGQMDLFNKKPIKQYNFMERSLCPVLCTCPVLQVDVVEGNDMHMVIVAMPSKIVVLKFMHTFETEHCISEEIPPQSLEASSN